MTTSPTISTSPTAHPPPVFVTMPTAAKALGIPDAEALARKLPVVGVQPDGLLSFGGKMLPIFSPGRFADLRAALGMAQSV